jgi:hypothetical protein
LQAEQLEPRWVPAPLVFVGGQTYAGNGDTGFGGPIGGGSLTLTDNGTTLSGTVTKGPNGFNDALVLYLQTGAGGFADTSGFNDAGDGLRRAISGIDGGGNRSLLTFTGGFKPNYAIALGPADDNFGGLWSLANGGNNSLPFVTSVNLSPTGTNSAATYSFSVALSSLGLAGNGAGTMGLLGTYISNSGFRSTEAVAGNVSGTQGWNPFVQTAGATYTTAVTSVSAPENTKATNSGIYSSATGVSGPGVVDHHDGTWSWSGTGDESTPLTITVTATDGSNTATTSFSVAFTDVGPAFVSQAQNAITTTQGVAATNSGVFSDFDDALTIMASQGTLTDHHDGTWDWSQNGTPADSGTVTVTATSADGPSVSTTFSVTFNPALAITTTTLPGGRSGSAYSQTVHGSGGTGSVTFSKTGGTLPPGLTLSSGGVVSGTPTTAGSYSFTVTATDSVGATAGKTYAVSILQGTLLSMPTSGFSGQEGGTVLAFPVSINQLQDNSTPTNHLGLSVVNVAITFPAGVFNFPIGSNAATADVHLGTIPAGAGGAGSWTLTANAPADGALNLTLQAHTGANITSNNPAGGGSLFTIDFPIWNTFNPASSTSEAISIVATSGSAHTTVQGNNGVYTLSPTPPYSGSITINPRAQFPPTITTPQSYLLEANGTLNIASPGLLVGASDPQGQVVSVNTINGAAFTPGNPISLPSGATLTVQSNGAFTYVPVGNFVGMDSFTFTAKDQATPPNVSSTGTVNIQVTATLSLQPESVTSGPTGTVIKEDVVLNDPAPLGGFGPLEGFNVAITYDAGAIATAADASQITEGTSIPSDWTFDPNASTPGVIAIGAFNPHGDTISSPAPLVLATINFTIVGSLNQTTAVKIVPSARANGALITTQLTGVGGTYPLNPALNGVLFVPGIDTTIAVTGEPGPVTLGPSSPLPSGDVGIPYSGALNAIGGDGGPFSYGVTSGSLPPGISGAPVNDPQFLLSGTPTTAGTYSFTITATDPDSNSGSKLYSLTINPAVSITTTTLPKWTVNQPGYNSTITVTGGTGSYTFSLASGALPTGLNLSSSGVLSGTPTVTGNYSFSISAHDTLGSTDTKSYTVVINTLVVITTTTLPNWTVNAAGYNQTITATGGTDSKTFTAPASSLPTGLTLSGSGVLSGTPTATGTYTFTVTATDTVGASAMQSFTVTINPAVVITTTTLPNWTVNVAGYSQTISATGGTGGNTFSAPAASLPTGLTLSSSGVLSGTPTAAGSYTFTVMATDTVGATATQTYTVVINPAVTINTTTLPAWTVNQPGYGQTITASGGTGTLTFAKTSGTLPTGLTFSSSGVLSGTPTAANTSPGFTFTVTATDTLGATGSKSFTVIINPAVTITTTTLANWTVNQPGYSQTISATGGTGAKTFAATAGTLPTGLALSSGGALSGTPSATGTYTFTVTATDTVAASGSQSYTVTINPAVTITTTSLASWTVNQPGYNQTITATGGTPGYTFAKSAGNLPTGLTLSSAGVLAGMPTVVGNYVFAITATDSTGATGSQSFSVVINPTVVITTTTLPSWTVNQPGYSATVTAIGGTGAKTFSRTAGTLPTGLTLSSVGVLSGTPTATGTYSFTIKATDTINVSGSQSYTVVINPTVAITTTALVNWTVNQPGYSQTISATGGTGAKTFATTAGTLPTGLTLGSGGVLSGTPSATGTYTFTVTATDTVGATANQSYMVTINSAVTITTATLPDGTLTIPYSQTISALGGTGSKTFATASGTLPTGLTLSSAGVLSGTPTALGTYSFTVTATDTVGASGSQSYTVTIYPEATKLVLTAPGTAMAGTGFSLTITAEDDAGDLAGAYSGTVTLSSSAGPDIAPTSVLVTHGTATLMVTLTSAGTQTVTAAASGLTSGTASILVSPGPFSQFLVAVQGPTTVQAGTAVPVSVQAADTYGNPITVGYSGPSSVTASITPASGLSNFPLTVPLNSFGAGFFNGILDQVGSYTISVTGGSFSGSSLTPVVVTPGAADQLVFSAQPLNTPTGVVLSTVSVQIEDQFGNVLTSDSTDAVAMLVGSGPGGFTAGSTTTVTAHNGVVSFSNLTLVVPGSYTLRAELPSVSTFTNSSSFTIAPLQVVPGSLATSPSGFSLAFNGPYLVNSLTPALYGPGFGNNPSLPAQVTPTVTLTQLTGTPPTGFTLPYQVEGSVVLNAATNHLTFLATNTASLAGTGSPLLADGDYRIDITSSGVNGLQAFNPGGGYLDGLSSGVPGSGDYTATFSVNVHAADQDAVWVPPTAEGPAQFLNAPGNNQAGGGYPLYLSDSAGTVTSVSATLTYNPALLNVSSGPGSPGLTVTVTTPGTALLSYSGPALEAGAATPIGYIGWSGPEPLVRQVSGGTLSAGTYTYLITATNGGSESLAGLQSLPVTTGGANSTVLLTWAQGILATGYKIYSSSGSGYSLLATIAGGGTLSFTDDGSHAGTPGTPPTTGSTAQVPSGTVGNPVPYRSKDLLHLSGVSLNGGTLPVVTSDGLHVVAFVGDATGDGKYLNDDATALIRAAIQVDTGFSHYPLIDPVIVGDVNGSGFIGADSALQALDGSVGFLAPNLPFPALPPAGSIHFAIIGSNTDPSVSIPAALSVGANGTVRVPVNIDDAHPTGSTGLVEGHVALTYDPRQFTVSAADVHLGSLLAASSGWSFVPTIDPATGQIAIAFSSDTPIISTAGGSLLTIDFHPVGGIANPSPIALVPSASPNGQYVTTELEDAQGTFTLTPSPATGTFVGNAGIVEMSATAPVASAGVVTTTVPVVVEQTDIHAVASAEALVLTPTALTSEPSGEEVSALAPPTIHVAAAAPHAPAVTSPLTAGLVFQVTNTPVVGVPISLGVAAWQHLTDQLFQVLTRYDAGLTGPARETLERVLTSQLLLGQPIADDLDGLDWAGASSTMDWQRDDTRSSLRPARREQAACPASPTAVLSAHRATLDQVFAQAADDTDLMVDDE